MWNKSVDKLGERQRLMIATQASREGDMGTGERKIQDKRRS